jgi:hypothetical protein
LSQQKKQRGKDKVWFHRISSQCKKGLDWLKAKIGLFLELFRKYSSFGTWRQKPSFAGRGGNTMVREMKVVGLVINQQTESTVVVLKDLSSDFALPIVIGLLEATNIAAKLENVALPRPMTHDLLKNIMDQLEVEVDRVEISDLKNETFYAWIYLSANDRETKIDARPSDALAIALRTGSRIYINENVIQKYETIMTRNETETLDGEAKEWTEILENLSPKDFQRYKI